MALKTYKKDFGYSYAYGVSATLELLRSRPQDVLTVHIHAKSTANKGIEEIRALALQNGVELNEASAAIDRLTDTENTYAVGVFRKFENPLDATKNHVVLAQIQDKGNLGTIIRSALAFGITDIAIIKPAVDIFDPKVVRASMGAIFGMRFAYFSTFADYQKTFVRNYYPFILDDSATSLLDTRFEAPYSLVFGSESEGLNSTYKKIGEAIQIPQSESVDSLNLSIAVGVALFVASQQ